MSRLGVQYRAIVLTGAAASAPVANAVPAATMTVSTGMSQRLRTAGGSAVARFESSGLRCSVGA
jgi:hypothetical protein